MNAAPALPPARRLARAAAAFVAIGLLLYAALYAASERLVLRYGHSNPFYKIATAQPEPADWLILGASHAMPLDFGDFNAGMERDTGLKILNLGSPGTGPLYNRLVLEQFLRNHRAAHVLYVVDSFAFYSRAWNEERFADAKLLARTPWDPPLASALAQYVLHDGVSWRAALDYASGFSKVNNRDRFKVDSWEGEAQFERTWRPSASAVKKRIEYLYPDGTPAPALARYLEELDRIVMEARHGGAQVQVIKLPLPPALRGALPAETAFDSAMAAHLARIGISYGDYSQALPEPGFYFDSDHLNRKGVTAFYNGYLKRLLSGSASPD